MRGRGAIAMILQDPKYSLNPVMTIGRQIVETLRTHATVASREARDRARSPCSTRCRSASPSACFDLYPHEVSGGMGQRVMIAMMLIAGPELLIADEPTSALDVTVQLEMLAILDELVRDRGMGLIFISPRPAAGLVASATASSSCMRARSSRNCRASDLAAPSIPIRAAC